DAPPARPSCGSAARPSFPFLPHAAAEARDVADLWNRMRSSVPAVVLVGRRASKAELMRSVAGADVLHLATHGFFARTQCPRQVGLERGEHIEAPAERLLLHNPLLESGLALAGANRLEAAGDEAEDGLLTAAEIAALDLSGARWVVLSACGSGLGQVRAGEGVMSLQRAFAIAGARAVIMTLWSVEDAQARLWMRTFYEARLLRSLDLSRAVREADAQLVERLRRGRGAAPPALWAAFVAAGDWR